MTPYLVIAAVWAVSMLLILRLVHKMSTRYPVPDKWEPRPRQMIHVEVTPGAEAEAAELVLRMDLHLSEVGQ